MILFAYGESVQCERVERGVDFLRVFDENGALIREDIGVSDFSGYSLSGGDFTPAPKSQEDQEKEARDAEMTDLQLALVEVYEQILGGV